MGRLMTTFSVSLEDLHTHASNFLGNHESQIADYTAYYERFIAELPQHQESPNFLAWCEHIRSSVAGQGHSNESLLKKEITMLDPRVCAVCKQWLGTQFSFDGQKQRLQAGLGQSHYSHIMFLVLDKLTPDSTHVRTAVRSVSADWNSLQGTEEFLPSLRFLYCMYRLCVAAGRTASAADICTCLLDLYRDVTTTNHGQTIWRQIPPRFDSLKKKVTVAAEAGAKKMVEKVAVEKTPEEQEWTKEKEDTTTIALVNLNVETSRVQKRIFTLSLTYPALIHTPFTFMLRTIHAKILLLTFYVLKHLDLSGHSKRDS